MKSIDADHARQIWDDIRNGIFSTEMLVLINLEKLKYPATADRTYFDMRNTSSASVIGLVQKLLAVPDLAVTDMCSLVREQPLSVQSFLFDRFLYVDEYLGKLHQQEFFSEEDPADFLSWGLIDIWESRSREGVWK